MLNNSIENSKLIQSSNLEHFISTQYDLVKGEIITKEFSEYKSNFTPLAKRPVFQHVIYHLEKNPECERTFYVESIGIIGISVKRLSELNEILIEKKLNIKLAVDQYNEIFGTPYTPLAPLYNLNILCKLLKEQHLSRSTNAKNILHAAGIKNVNLKNRSYYLEIPLVRELLATNLSNREISQKLFMKYISSSSNTPISYSVIKALRQDLKNEALSKSKPSDGKF